MSSLQYPWPQTPAPGTTLQVAPGVRWLSMPLPFQLDHINLWLLDDDGGCTIVDCGIGDAETRALWEKILPPDVGRIIVTHYHPDHAGNAGWLCERFGVQMWTTQGEYLTAHAVRSSSAGYTGEAVLSVFKKNGLDPERSAAMARMRGNNRYAELVPEFPHAYRRIIEGDRVRIGGRDWRAIIGHGHAPEHLSLYCEEANVLIAGDMLLSTISTNVSVWSIDPEGDPLRLFLESVARYRELPEDVLVLPSHGRPFRGAHLRVRQLEEHHDKRFKELLTHLDQPKSANDLLPVLFRRPLDAHQTFFAMGEAIAHLHYLYYAGEAKRAVGDDGVVRYAKA
ncbi:MAG TPA: MBL fold metallo-hydrolase [Burkholderiales bacterium]|nr:MBL fold metallo-hydrolase [Burkholderiales bacterium]